MTFIARWLVTVVAAWAAGGSYIFDWNATHIYNSAWPPHAKFHNAQTMLLGTALGLLSLARLWRQRGDERRRIVDAATLASLYWLTQAGALLFPGTALVDPAFSHPHQPPAQLVVDAVMLTLLASGVILELRRIRREARTP